MSGLKYPVQQHIQEGAQHLHLLFGQFDNLRHREQILLPQQAVLLQNQFVFHPVLPTDHGCSQLQLRDLSPSFPCHLKKSHCLENFFQVKIEQKLMIEALLIFIKHTTH